MKLRCFSLPFALIALSVSVAEARAQLTAISGLYTSGVRSNGTTLGNNASDSHYVVTASSAGLGYTGNSFTVATGALDPAWAANTTSARWIVDPKPGSGDGNNAARPSGTYDYTLSFTMPAGAQLDTVSIDGLGAAADSASIYVNGILVSGQSLAGSGSLGAFTLNATNSSFLSGANTITFRVANSVNNSATGLLIGTLGGSVVVPEVGAWLPIAGALGLFARLCSARLSNRYPVPSTGRSNTDAFAAKRHSAA